MEYTTNEYKINIFSSNTRSMTTTKHFCPAKYSVTGQERPQPYM